MKEKTVFERIYEQVKRIPKGRVATYGQIALYAGNPRWARVVGYALHVRGECLKHLPSAARICRFLCSVQTESTYLMTELWILINISGTENEKRGYSKSD